MVQFNQPYHQYDVDVVVVVLVVVVVVVFLEEILLLSSQAFPVPTFNRPQVLPAR